MVTICTTRLKIQIIYIMPTEFMYFVEISLETVIFPFT